MKKILLLTAMILFGVIGYAQFIYNDFDANQNVTFTGWPNSPTIIANPDPSGINTSPNVAEFVRSTEQWAHTYVELDGYIDFTTGNTFQLKVYAPIACEVLFKLEDKTNSGVFVEVMGNVTTPNQWELLTYDFTGAASGTYDKIVIFFDFATLNDNTFYFDDVEGPEYGGGSTNDPVTLPVTFDEDNVAYNLVDFGGNASQIVEDPTEPGNNVAETLKTEGAETWAGTTIGGTTGFPEAIPFAPNETFMHVRVWSPLAGIPIRLKVEDANDPTKSVETEAMTTVCQEWEVLLFDFSNEAPGTEPIHYDYNYNKASIFFNFGQVGAGETFYWDDMDFGPIASMAESTISQLNFVQNPVTNTLLISSEFAIEEINLFNITGQRIEIQKTGFNSFDVSILPQGIYTIVTEDYMGNTYIGKIFKL